MLLPAMALLTTGCGGMLTSDAPAERVYWLEPLGDVAVDFPGTDSADDQPTIALRVEAVPGLDTDRLLVLEEDARLTEYAAARWADRAPEVVESLLRTSLEVNGAFPRVAHHTATAGSDALLALELRRFFVHEGNAQLELAGYLDCGDSTHAISALASAPVREERLASIVAAFQAALDDVSANLIHTVAESHCL